MALLPLLAGLATTAIGASSASKAAGAQKSAANSQLELGREQIAEQQRQFDLTNALQQQIRDDNLGIASDVRENQLGYASGARDAALGYAEDTRNANLGVANDVQSRQLNYLEPYANTAAQGALNYELGIGSKPSDYTGFRTTPGYDFRFGQGQRAIDGSAAASGNLFSGATLKAQQRFGTGLADQEYGNHLARLSQQASAGRSVAGAQSGVVGQFGSAATNANNIFGANAINAGNSFGASGANANSNFGAMATGANTGYGNAYQNASNAMSAGKGNAYAFQGNALANLGDAAAAGAVGVGNALNAGINQGVGLWNFQNRVGGNKAVQNGFF